MLLSTKSQPHPSALGYFNVTLGRFLLIAVLDKMHLVRDYEEPAMKDPAERGRSKQRCDVFSVSFLTCDVVVPVTLTENN